MVLILIKSVEMILCLLSRLCLLTSFMEDDLKVTWNLRPRQIGNSINLSRRDLMKCTKPLVVYNCMVEGYENDLAHINLIYLHSSWMNLQSVLLSMLRELLLIRYMSTNELSYIVRPAEVERSNIYSFPWPKRLW